MAKKAPKWVSNNEVKDGKKFCTSICMEEYYTSPCSLCEKKVSRANLVKGKISGEVYCSECWKKEGEAKEQQLKEKNKEPEQSKNQKEKENKDTKQSEQNSTNTSNESWGKTIIVLGGIILILLLAWMIARRKNK